MTSAGLSELDRQRIHYAAVRKRLWQVSQQKTNAVMRPIVAPTPKRDWLRLTARQRLVWPPLSERMKFAIPLVKLVEAVTVVMGITMADFASTWRGTKVVRARAIYYWLARQYSTASLSMIGRQCGGRDHSTVHNGFMKVRKNMDLYRSDILSAQELLGITTHNVRE